MLVCYAGKADLLYRGMLKKSKIPYDPNKILPKWVQILFCILNLCALLLYCNVTWVSAVDYMAIFLSVGLAISCLIISLQYATSPFLGMKKKLAYNILNTIFCWGMIFVFMSTNDMLTFVSKL